MATPANKERPLPSPTQQAFSQSAQQQQQRPNSRRFSFLSDKSRKNSVANNNKIDLHETHAEKDSRRLHSKADPTLAMNEAEPCMFLSSVPRLSSPLSWLSFC